MTGEYSWITFVTVTLHFLQNFTGFNIIQSFGPSVMKDAGMGGDRPQDLLYSMIYLTSVISISTFIGISMSKKYGRR